MSPTIETITFFFGKAICHQLPERSLTLNGHYLPLCARCTGIYIGIFCSLLFLLLTKKLHSNQIPTIKHSIYLLLFLLPLMIDGFGSYIGLFPTNNAIRILTGILFGVTLPFFVVPLLSRSLQTDKRVITNIKHFIIPILIAFSLASITKQELISGHILAIVLIGAVIIWVTILFFLLYKRVQSNIITTGLSFASSLFTLTVFSLFHSFVNSIDVL